MKIPDKMLPNGFGMPVLGLGTWQMGGRYEHLQENDDPADIKAIQTAIELGITHIDTAEAYAAGYTETLIGKAVKEYDREKLFLATKVSPEHHSYKDLIASCVKSLERLKTTYIDLYLLHSPSHMVPIKETMKAMNELMKNGLIKHIGVSNFSMKQLKQAQSLSTEKIVTNQVHYNLSVREIEHNGLLAYCQEENIILTAYRPIQKGFLFNDAEDYLMPFCKKYKKTPVQIALNWLISQKNVVSIIKARSIHHLKENIGAVGWEMDEEDIGKLRKEFPRQQAISDVYPLDGLV